MVPLGSGWGSGACLPYFLFFRSGACLPSSLFFLSSGKGFLFHHDLLVPPGSGWVPVLVSLLLSPFFSSEKGCVSSWISWFLFVLGGVPVLVSLLLLFFSHEVRQE